MASSGVTDNQENNHAAAAARGDEIDELSEEFVCCVCLDLIYKPVVLPCGHILCFWCAYGAIGCSWQELRCPVCRQSYNNFPSICRQLHFVLMKLYPLVYKRRERQAVEVEKIWGAFSPKFDGYLCESYSSKEGELSLVKDSSQVVLSVDKDFMKTNPVLITDVLPCALCKQLLYRPVVLNCGHVFCEGCIINPSDKLCRCPECQSMHPCGFPKVCLAIEHFLEEHFSEEYAARRVAVGKLSVQAHQPDDIAKCSSLATDDQSFGQGQKVHYAVGCDCCGMYPITGERYKCKDCVDEFGFDLCEGCYKSSSSKLAAGRFNQQHRPEHKFEILEPQFFLNEGSIEEYGTYNSPEEESSPQSDSETDLPALSSSNETDLPAYRNSSNETEEASEPGLGNWLSEVVHWVLQIICVVVIIWALVISNLR